MLRVVSYLVLMCLVALGVVWMADRPGEVTITWLGQQRDMSVMTLALAVLAIAVLAVLLWSLVRALMRSPRMMRHAMRNRRERKGYEAISRGLIAIGSGDARAAQRHAENAQKSLPDAPLALLLRAQTAQMNGDRAGAEDAFRAMAERDDTRLLGLRGLFIEAQRRNDARAAFLYAEEAAKSAPALAWAGNAVLEFRCAAGDWEGALAILERHRKAGMLDRDVWRRHRAVLLTARAQAEEAENRDVARALAVEATKLAPDLVPAAAFAGRLLAEAGEKRKAVKIIEAAWKASPHPDLAETYAHVRLSDSARDRLARTQALARMAPGHAEGALAVARAALDARELGAARAALEPLAREPTQRVAMLMAELEGLEGDDGRARQWMARAMNAARDPAWTADGHVSDTWLPVSPATGRIDAFQWKVPVAELGPERALVDLTEAKPLPPVQPAPVPPPAVPAAAPVIAEVAEAPPREIASPPLAAPVAEPAPAPAPIAPRPAAAVPKPAPIMPLTQPPDDPGPEPDPAEAPPPEGWQRIRQIFR